MDNNIQKARKIPMRQCLGCNAHRPKKELIRVVRTPEGAIVLDLVGKKSGRGAYICKNKKCLEMAFKKKQLDYSFKEKVSAETYEKLKEELSKYAEG